MTARTTPRSRLPKTAPERWRQVARGYAAQKARRVQRALDKAMDALSFYARRESYQELPIDTARRLSGGVDPMTGLHHGTYSVEASPGYALSPIEVDMEGTRARDALRDIDVILRSGR